MATQVLMRRNSAVEIWSRLNLVDDETIWGWNNYLNFQNNLNSEKFDGTGGCSTYRMALCGKIEWPECPNPECSFLVSVNASIGLRMCYLCAASTAARGYDKIDTSNQVFNDSQKSSIRRPLHCSPSSANFQLKSASFDIIDNSFFQKCRF